MKVNDKKIIFYIKYLPFYFLIATTFIFFLYILISNHFNEINEKNKLTKTLQEEYNLQIKNETTKIIDYINHLKQNKEKEIIKLLKAKSDTAFDIINSIYLNNKNKSKEEILSLIKVALQDIRYFDGRGYYYINDINTGFCYFHPVFKELENTSLLEVKDANGLYLTKEMIRILKDKNEGHLKYYWYKEGNKEKQFEKIAYLQKFDPLGIYFVISDYTDSIDSILQQEVKLLLNSLNFPSENNYYIIDKTNNKYIFHSYKDLINKNLSEVLYLQNYKRYLKEIEDIKQGYHHSRVIINNNIVNKVSYVETFNDWNWIIGFGYYEDDIINIINKEIEKLEDYHSHSETTALIFLMVVAIIVLLVSRYFSKIIERRFKTYNFSINRKIVEIGRQQRVLAQQTKMAAMGEMIENIAHQWRQPLSIISTCSTGLKLSKDYDTLDDETFYSNVKSINDSAQYLSTTIDDFRNFYERSNEDKEFRVDDVIHKSLDLLKTKIQAMNINIDTNIKKTVYKGYENQLLQVILNLIKNAIDQFADIKDSDYKFYIKIDLYKNQDGIFLEFTDNAGGINPEIIDRIFEPYFTTKNKSIGTGIGLYMSRNIIEKHFHGSLNAKNIVLVLDNKNYKCAKFTINIKQ